MEEGYGEKDGRVGKRVQRLEEKGGKREKRGEGRRKWKG